VADAPKPPAAVQLAKEDGQEPLLAALPVKRKLRYAILPEGLETSRELPRPQSPAYAQPAAPALMELPVQQRDLRYILIPVENGLKKRLSAKFAAVLYGAPNSDGTATEPSAHPLLRNLEKKMLSSVFVPDPGNLFDLVMFSQLMQEEQ
jgi:hypothetical protein